MKEKIANGVVKTPANYPYKYLCVDNPMIAQRKPEIEITKGFTAKKIDDASTISLTNTTMVRHDYGSGADITIPEGAWERSARMVIASCRPNRENEQE